MRKANKLILSYLESTIEVRKSAKMAQRPGYHYACMEELLLDAGQFYHSNALTKEEKNHVLECIEGLGFEPEQKQCYYNSQLLCLMDFTNQIKYCEGFAYSGLIPLLHAWISINDKVVDVTWRKDYKKDGAFTLGEFNSETAYMGLNVPKRTIRETLFEKEQSISFIDNYEDGWPLLKNKFIKPKNYEKNEKQPVRPSM